MTVLDWLLDSYPAIRWHDLRVAQFTGVFPAIAAGVSHESQDREVGRASRRRLPTSLRESHPELRTACQVELLRYRGQPSRVEPPAVRLHFRPYPWPRSCTQDSDHRT